MTIKTKLIILSVILVLALGAGTYYWLKLTGRIKIGAEAIIGCQGSSKISSFFGPPGSHLVSYNLFGNQILVHEYIIPYLDNIQKEVNAAKTGYNFTDIQSFNIRSKIGGGGRSLHSWGIALDINPATNPYQRGNYGPPQSDIPIQIVNIFKKYGFAWGGDWPGERDPMHFEWYGAEIFGSVLDKVSTQKILSVATDVDGAGSPNANGDYRWLVPFGSHTITAKARGYNDNSFAVSLACFSDTAMNIDMNPLPSNLPGSIAGKVKISGNYPMLVPANISLDGRLVAIGAISGDYYIPNVHEGKHTVTAQIMFFPSGSTTAEVIRGESLKNINITIGK